MHPRAGDGLSGYVTAFSSALAVSNTPTTRTKETVAAKNLARKNLVAYTRILIRLIQATPGLSDAQRASLGLPIPSAEPTPIQPPDTAPVLEVVSVFGRTIKCKAHDAATPSKRGKGPGIAGISIFTFVGEIAPDDWTLWTYQGTATRTVFEVEIPAAVEAGSKVFLTGFWVNPRNQQGPACFPIATYISGGLPLAA